ncbi:hypothetical protein [Photobacterium halotolerans]|uniref:hypothetical protein n=1 Tax=Photobacterium halotolerans TaxID=265726 RepID=UPI00069640DA|nr:hypothetical protein [Photobacterium halotolerans]
MWNHKIFSDLREHDDDFIGHVAYSLYKDQKVKWIHHFNDKNGRYPSSDEIDQYFTSFNSSEESIAKYRDDAERMLNDFFDYSFQEELMSYKESIKNEAIIQAVHKPFGKSVWENLAAGFIASALTAILSLSLWLYSEMKSSERRAELLKDMPIPAQVKELVE